MCNSKLVDLEKKLYGDVGQYYESYGFNMRIITYKQKSIWNYIIKKENCMNMKVDSCILKKESLEILIVKSDTSCMALFYWLKVI